jgi:endonuclease/exonuclease/phosphatase (EEP) superfamily protein YafD
MTPPRTRFRIVSANLWNGAADPAAFAELVTRLGADAVATQEMNSAQAEALSRALPHGKLEPADNYQGMGIALREPARVHRVALPYRDARVADIRWSLPTGGHLDLELLNVHFHAPHNSPGWGIAHRRGQLRGVVRHIVAAPQRRRVLVGDLNATPVWPVYRRLTAHLTDAAVAAAQRRGLAPRPTWGPWPSAPRVLRIDHALVHGVAVEDFRVVPVVGADHSAIVVDLAVPVAAIEDAHRHDRLPINSLAAAD